MNWKERYADRICTVSEAISNIHSGDRVMVAHACSEPVILTEALAAYGKEANLKNVEIVHMVPMGTAEYCKPGMEEHFRHNGLFLGTSTKQAVAEGRGDFTPVFYHEIPALLREELRADVALLQVSEPDEHGFCSFGLSNDYTKPGAERANIRIAQINKNQPRTLGDNFIHISELDYIVLMDTAMIQLPPPKIGDVQEEIGKNIASLVKDGDCLQLGIGAIPDAVLLFLKDKKELGLPRFQELAGR